MEALGRVNYYGLAQSPFTNIPTINLSAGVTPIVMFWQGREYRSSLYYLMPRPTSLRVVLAWYRPTIDEFDKLQSVDQKHVLMGGLLHGEIGEVRRLEGDPVQETWTQEMLQVFTMKVYGRRA